MNKKLFLDVAERVLWTAAEAALAVAAIYASNAPIQLVPLVAAGLAYLKGVVASKIKDANAALPLWAEDATIAVATEATEKVAKIAVQRANKK